MDVAAASEDDHSCEIDGFDACLEREPRGRATKKSKKIAKKSEISEMAPKWVPNGVRMTLYVKISRFASFFQGCTTRRDAGDPVGRAPRGTEASR